MGFFKNVFGNKTEKVELKKQKSTEYFIDIDPNSNSFSTAFKDFYKNHFIDAYGLARREVDTYFFDSMTTEEKEIAKRLIRQNQNYDKLICLELPGYYKTKKHYHSYMTNFKIILTSVCVSSPKNTMF